MTVFLYFLADLPVSDGNNFTADLGAREHADEVTLIYFGDTGG